MASCEPTRRWSLTALVALVALQSTSVACATLQRRAPCKPGQFATATGTCVPEAWHCSPSLYAAGAEDGCDCNCGAPDPDCNKRAQSTWCYGLGMARRVQHCHLCDAAPGERLMQALLAEAPAPAPELAPGPEVTP